MLVELGLIYSLGETNEIGEEIDRNIPGIVGG
jgi:hypothetical protein